MNSTESKSDKKDIDEELLYWITKTPGERLAEVTRLIKLDLEPGQTMDRTHVVQKMMHPDK